MKTYTKEEVVAIITIAGARLIENTSPAISIMVMGLQAEVLKEMELREKIEGKEGEKNA